MADQDFSDELRTIEQRWQEQWRDADLYKSDPSNEDKFYITVAYPYPSGGMHIGHVRTYTLPDVFARFKRMQGYNVLFPMAWHVTGTPIIGALQRLHDGEQDQLDVLKNTFNVPQEELDAMEEPMDYARYFIDTSYRPGMQQLGFGVDWRREFTTNDEHYQKFIEWQYTRLRDAGLVEQGKHPIKYCLDDENPVTTHDLLEGEDAEKQEYTLVKFTGEDGRVYPMATLRPETVFGVTHTLVDPDGAYMEAEVDGDPWVIAADAATKLAQQGHTVDVQREVDGRELVGRTLTNPVTGDEVVMLPASFVDTSAGSGLVMSVPAHAPYDWISLQELQQDADELADEYDIDAEDIRNITPISIIAVDGYGDYPAEEACEEHDVQSQDDEAALEAATDDVYEKEHHSGVLKDNCGRFAGEQISRVKDDLIAAYEETGSFGALWDFSEDVICRCGGTVIVAEKDSWFLTYGDKAWKDKASACLNQLETIPADTRDDYSHTIDWLESWPCIRNYGLGTKLPFDEEFVVEPLSDSTIYMAFYTIAHIVKDVDADKLEPRAFDYVFRGEGPAEDVADETGIAQETLEEMRESFDYWYPLDWRTSAHELIQNHLTFFMFHHAALFPRDKWPQGIATWGMGQLEGKSMSSSKGHVVLAEEAVERYGADTSRFFLFSNAEPWQDFDWRSDEVKTYQNKLRQFDRRVRDLFGSGADRDLTRIDRYMLSRLHRTIATTTEALEDFQTRKASLHAFFELNNAVDWYRKRTDTLNTRVVNEVIETQLKLLSPFIPHLAEELWHHLGHEDFIATADWPQPDDDTVDPAIEAGEQYLQAVMDDVHEIENMVEDYHTVRLIVAADWQYDATAIIQEQLDDGVSDVGQLMGALTQEEDLKRHGEQLSAMAQDYLQQPGDLPDASLDAALEHEILEDAQSFLADHFDAAITVEAQADSDHDKASRARPGTPAIVLE